MGRTAHLFKAEDSGSTPGKRLPRQPSLPIMPAGPVSQATESVFFNAVPLLVLATAYLAVGAMLAPTLWRERAQLTLIDTALATLFPCLGVMAAVWGAVVLADRQPIGGHVWIPFGAS